MKHFFIIVYLFISLSLPAQTYCVALVKGEVFYEDVLLKPRTKIELKGAFRFTTKDDYVKVSGPEGIHTIRPVEKESGGYEFLRAVTQELFPAAKPRGRFVLSAWRMVGDAINIHAENEFHPVAFVGGERIPLDRALKKWQYKDLYWVAETSNGRIVRELAKVVDGYLELTSGIFKEARGADTLSISKAYLFYLSDVLYFRGLADRFPLSDIFWATNPEVQPAEDAGIPEGDDPQDYLYNKLSSADGETIYRPYPDIMGLSWVSPEMILDREMVMEDMLHFFLASGETSIKLFLLGGRDFEREDYSVILRELYGEMNFHRVGPAFLDYLYEKRKEDLRIKELWKLNKGAFR